MIKNLVWLFSEHRLVVQQNAELQRAIEGLARQLEAALARVNVGGSDVTSMLQNFQDQILVDEPFKDNRIPEDAYLTPAGSDI